VNWREISRMFTGAWLGSGEMNKGGLKLGVGAVRRWRKRASTKEDWKELSGERKGSLVKGKKKGKRGATRPLWDH